jgi:hypothetical protein
VVRGPMHSPGMRVALERRVALEPLGSQLGLAVFP